MYIIVLLVICNSIIFLTLPQTSVQDDPTLPQALAGVIIVYPAAFQKLTNFVPSSLLSLSLSATT